MKHTDTKYFDDFLDKEVNLNQGRLDSLQQKVGAVTSYLEDNLPDYRKCAEQGSFAHKTIIKPVQDNDEFDADILVFMTDKDFSPDKFNDFVKIVYDTLKANGNYSDKLRLNTRCVTIDYAGDFHLDVVPCIEHEGNFYICNRIDGQYEKTDGEGYKEWLIGKNKIVGGNYFRKATRLLKFLRGHKKNFSVKSILLTTLLGRCVDGTHSDCVDVPSTLLHLSEKLNSFLQNHPQMPEIENPVLPEENFNRNWDQIKYAHFCKMFNIYYEKIKDAYDERDHNTSVEKWRKLFGDNFGHLKDSSSTGKTSAGAVAATFPVVHATKPYADSRPRAPRRMLRDND